MGRFVVPKLSGVAGPAAVTTRVESLAVLLHDEHRLGEAVALDAVLATADLLAADVVVDELIVPAGAALLDPGVALVEHRHVAGVGFFRPALVSGMPQVP